MCRPEVFRDWVGPKDQPLVWNMDLRNSADDRLLFAVRFAHMRLDQLRQGDRLNLRDDLTTFLGVQDPEIVGVPPYNTGGIRVSVTEKPPTELTDADIADLQRATIAMLKSQVVTEYTTEDGAVLEGTVQFSAIVPLPTGMPGGLLFRGSGPDMFVLVLSFLLSQQAVNRIQVCPECGKLFLRMRKQQYCSRTCVTRVNKRDARRREAKREEASYH